MYMCTVKISLVTSTERADIDIIYSLLTHVQDKYRCFSERFNECVYINALNITYTCTDVESLIWNELLRC